MAVLDQQAVQLDTELGNAVAALNLIGVDSRQCSLAQPPQTIATPIQPNYTPASTSPCASGTWVPTGSGRRAAETDATSHDAPNDINHAEQLQLEPRRKLAHPGHNAQITIATLQDTSTFDAFNIDGVNVENDPTIFPGTSIPRLHYSHLNMSTYDERGYKPVVNNLGGLGPGTYMCEGVPTDPGLGCSGWAQYVKPPPGEQNYIKIRDVCIGPRGERVSMKVYNTSQYLSAGLEVGQTSLDNRLRNNSPDPTCALSLVKMTRLATDTALTLVKTLFSNVRWKVSGASVN